MPDVGDSAELDLAKALGAEPAESFQVLTLYISDRDRDGREIGNQRHWILEAAKLLAKIGGGVTIEAAAEGVWYDEERDNMVWEHTVRLFTYVKTDAFVERLDELRSFLHAFGRDARQGEVAVEFDGRFHRIRSFDQ